MDPHSPRHPNASSVNCSSGPHSSHHDESNKYDLEALDERYQVCLICLYSLTAISSFVLNAITVIVLARYRHSELRKYLISLSVSDLLMSALSIPFTYTEYMLGHWIFPLFLCPLVRFVVTLGVFVSAATMTVIGINRHHAVMYPLREKNSLKCLCCNRTVPIRKSNVIAAIWILGIAVSMPEYLMHKADTFEYNSQCLWECHSIWPAEILDAYTVFIFSITFAIPLTILSILYARIGLKLWRRQMPGNVDASRDLTVQLTRVKVIKMLLVVVIVFAVAWLPIQTFSMTLFLYPDLRQDFIYQSVQYKIFIGTYFFAHWLSMFHSCLNPLIYCFMNDKFRSDLHDLLYNRGRGNQSNRCHQIVVNYGESSLNRRSDNQVKLIYCATKQDSTGRSTSPRICYTNEDKGSL